MNKEQLVQQIKELEEYRKILKKLSEIYVQADNAIDVLDRLIRQLKVDLATQILR